MVWYRPELFGRRIEGYELERLDRLYQPRTAYCCRLFDTAGVTRLGFSFQIYHTVREKFD